MTLKRTNKVVTREEPVQQAIETKPKLRTYIEAIAAKSENGEQVIGLKDHLNLTAHTLWMQPELFYILRFVNGQHTGEDIRGAFLHKYGEIFFEHDYENFIKRLDEHYLLDNEKYKSRYDEIVENFKSTGVRPNIYGGSSYPKEPDLFEEYIKKEQQKITSPQLDVSNKYVKGMVLPHIDIRLGISSYLHGYNVLAQAKPSDLYIIIGVGHDGLPNLFSLTDLDFSTPFGTIETDKEFIQKLINGLSTNHFDQELIHKKEHSIEFQTVMLKYFINKRFKIVPILTSFNHSDIREKNHRELKIFHQFAARLKHLLQRYQGKVTVIASVDFAHIGPRYGDASAPDRNFMTNVELSDRTMLTNLQRFDKPGFQNAISQNENRYRICGYSALSTLMEIIEPTESHLLDYSAAVMDEQKSTVTFASMIYL